MPYFILQLLNDSSTADLAMRKKKPILNVFIIFKHLIYDSGTFEALLNVTSLNYVLNDPLDKVIPTYLRNKLEYFSRYKNLIPSFQKLNTYIIIHMSI